MGKYSGQNDFIAFRSLMRAERPDHKGKGENM
jgi:hypothetical protein